MATNSMALALAIFLVWSVAHAADTDNNLPVPVTSKNSGPRYDIDMGINLVDSSTDQVSSHNDKPLKEAPKAEQENKKEATDSTEAQPGRVAIRRLWIYPDPMQARVRLMNPWTSLGTQQMPSHLFSLTSDNTYPYFFLRPRTMGSPFISDMLPNRRVEIPEDGSSTSEEREESRQSPPQLDNSQSFTPMRTFDAHQVMLDLLQHALSPRMDHFGDFGSSSPMSPFSPISGINSNSDKPEMKTESKEDIVEIDGEKYLRKTVISKHVGENVMFMTKKYILTPLNATTSEDGQSKPTTEAGPIDKRQQGSSTTADKPVVAPVTTPVEAPATTPVEAPATTPVEASSTTPVEASSTTPVEASSTTPVEASSTTPVEAPATTPVEAPATTPVVAVSSSTGTVPVVSNEETLSTTQVTPEVSPAAPVTATDVSKGTTEREREFSSERLTRTQESGNPTNKLRPGLPKDM